MCESLRRTMASKVHVVRMDSDKDEWCVTLNGYMVGSPVPAESLAIITPWLREALPEIKGALDREEPR